MDQTNERLVFDRIVHNCCEKREKPQYFLVSPKLLPGMRAMDDDLVTVLLVMNGPGITNDWDFSKRDLVLPSVYCFQRTLSCLVLPCPVVSDRPAHFEGAALRPRRTGWRRGRGSDCCGGQEEGPGVLQHQHQLQAQYELQREGGLINLPPH